VFHAGLMKILAQARADGIDPPVVPMALQGLWGSFFSRIERRDGKPKAMARPFRRGLFNRVALRIDTPLPAASVQPEMLRDRVAALLVAPA